MLHVIVGPCLHMMLGIVPVTLYALIDDHTLFQAVPTPEFRYGAGARVQGLDLLLWYLSINK